MAIPYIPIDTIPLHLSVLHSRSLNPVVAVARVREKIEADDALPQTRRLLAPDVRHQLEQVAKALAGELEWGLYTGDHQCFPSSTSQSSDLANVSGDEKIEEKKGKQAEIGKKRGDNDEKKIKGRTSSIGSAFPRTNAATSDLAPVTATVPASTLSTSTQLKHKTKSKPNSSSLTAAIAIPASTSAKSKQREHEHEAGTSDKDFDSRIERSSKRDGLSSSAVGVQPLKMEKRGSGDVGAEEEQRKKKRRKEIKQEKQK
ncbi:hypothetical protein HDU93_007899 [Gonapodya sp. JEL0774]|nr:hypothetical protein HDU93_007899 [Gonapodya sp. JEL0774]